MNRHTRISRFSKRTRILSGSAAAILIGGAVLSTPFIADAAEQQSAAVQETASLSQQGSLDHDQLSVYSGIATSKAEAQAQTALATAKSVINAADRKVDASDLETTTAQLADYKLLSVGRMVALTDATTSETAQTQAEIEAADAAAAKAAADAAAAAAAAEAARVANTPDGARAQARSIMASSYGWNDAQYQCLDKLWTKESGWSVAASNGGSGATGIPQALPGSKMAGAGSDWQTSARTQIIWGLGYIKGSYGTPCAAWSHSQSLNWY